MDFGEKLRQIRQSQNLTLDQAADRTGVSKPMLGQIERGQSSPTVNTLWKIASGLKIPFSVLLEEKKAEFCLKESTVEPDITEEAGAMRLWTLLPFDPLRGCELFYIELDPGCMHRSSAHQKYTEEMILPVNGPLRIEADQEIFELDKGSLLRFDGHVSHGYLNDGREKCAFYNLIFYGRTKG